jgi:type IV pilus assembly protein PilW
MISKKKTAQMSGFTLVEIMITLAISGIIMAAVYSAYISQQRTYLAQEQVVEMQQNVRASLSLLTKDIRMAGYDPGQAGGIGFVDNDNFSNGSATPLVETVFTSSTQISFTADLDGDGVIDQAAEDTDGSGTTEMTDMEQISYRLNGTDWQRYSTVSGVIEWQTIAEQIESIEFNYILDDASETTAPTVAQLSNIRSVEISILARALRSDQNFNNSITYTPGSGNAAWDINGATAGTGNPPNDNFRRRLLITTVQCRNMGL